MKFTIEITELENAAFAENREAEISRIVRHVADCVEMYQTCGVCHDINGNRVGTWEIKENAK